jgi:hypothetical protein
MGNESNKMTAVEWFIEKLEQKGDAWENLYVRRVQISIDTSDYLELKRQAKQMEKEQRQLSEEEMDMTAKEYVLYNDQKRDWVIEGMKLYREKLKNK